MQLTRRKDYVYPPEARHQSITNFLRRAAARFRVLSCYATDTDHRRTGTPDEDQRDREDQSHLCCYVFLRTSFIR